MLTEIFPHLRKPVILMEQKQQRERQQWHEKQKREQQKQKMQRRDQYDEWQDHPQYNQQPSRTFAELLSRGKVEQAQYTRYNNYHHSGN